MADKFILAIDLGTSGPKVALFSTQGELLGSEFEETHLTLLENGGAEQSPGEWWTAIDKAVKRLLSRGLVPNEDIVAIASTGQWSGTVAVDEAGKPLLPAIIWMDARGAPYIREMCGGGLEVQGYNVLEDVRMDPQNRRHPRQCGQGSNRAYFISQTCSSGNLSAHLQIP